jgi:hypothetical protein
MNEKTLRAVLVFIVTLAWNTILVILGASYQLHTGWLDK